MHKQKGYTLAITLIFVAAIVLIGYKFLNNDRLFNKLNNSSMKQNCEVYGGLWQPEHQECEWFVQSNCERFGGTYEPCASPCRHDPNAEICAEQCVQVCTFETSEQQN